MTVRSMRFGYIPSPKGGTLFKCFKTLLPKKWLAENDTDDIQFTVTSTSTETDDGGRGDRFVLKSILYNRHVSGIGCIWFYDY